jgi:hypothetical protein
MAPIPLQPALLEWRAVNVFAKSAHRITAQSAAIARTTAVARTNRLCADGVLYPEETLVPAALDSAAYRSRAALEMYASLQVAAAALRLRLPVLLKVKNVRPTPLAVLELAASMVYVMLISMADRAAPQTAVPVVAPTPVAVRVARQTAVPAVAPILAGGLAATITIKMGYLTIHRAAHLQRVEYVKMK